MMITLILLSWYIRTFIVVSNAHQAGECGVHNDIV